ncbi:MAG: thiamine diphosphokinase [Octadecabacter sp.]|nr:thiamine diphosphokinase [Octadecabacter sp.]
MKPASETLSKVLSMAPKVVAADGGADHAFAAGLTPEAVIGDMDSISGAARDAFQDVLHPIAEQNSTDFDKALRHIDAPVVLGLGFLGERFDHSLAALHVLLKYRARPVVLIGDQDVVFICPPKIALTLPVGMRISLMPITPSRVDTDGLKWDVLDGAMSMNDFIGSSNEVAKPLVTICATGGLAILTPLAALGSVVAALTDAAPAG